MKKCSECNIDMIDNCTIEGQHPFEVEIDGQTDTKSTICDII